MESTAGAVVLAVGAAADPIGAGGWAFLDRVGVADTVRVAPPVGEVAGAVGEVAGSVAVGMGAVGDAWPPEGAVGCSEGLALAVAVD